jgi:hypothetical protein
VELSIVLVIIGLILGGVMVGRSMIRSSQVNRIASDLEAYAAAAQMFVDKYQGIPGDMTNATTFWSSTIVANGDGNGLLSSAAGASLPGEKFGAWEHLALAGFIHGVFNGLSGVGGGEVSDIGVNVPSSKVAGTGYSWYYMNNSSGHGSLFDGYYGNFIFFGTEIAASVTYGPALTPQEAYAIDLKIDDGIPGTGTVLQYYSFSSCVTGTAATGPTSTYLTTSSAIACHLIYKTGL